jgi:putative oxidoreductase
MHLDQLNQRPVARGLRLLCRLGLAGLFLWAALPKLAEPGRFMEDLANYRVLPEAALAPIALGLPVLELLCALALLGGPYVTGSALLVSVLLFGFAAAMAQARARGIDLECGCFGAESRAQVSWEQVARNTAYAVVALWVAVSSRSASTTSAAPAKG